MRDITIKPTSQHSKNIQRQVVFTAPALTSSGSQQCFIIIYSVDPHSLNINSPSTKSTAAQVSNASKTLPSLTRFCNVLNQSEMLYLDMSLTVLGTMIKNSY